MVQSIDLRVIHASMQFDDSRPQHVDDAQTIFGYADRRKALFLTGTEAGATPDNHDLRQALAAAAKRQGWHLYAHEFGDWVAFDKQAADLVKSGYDGPFVPGSPGHMPRGIAWTTVTHPQAGKVTMGAVHYLTAKSIADTGHSNRPLADGIGAWGRRKGKGTKIVFLDGDVNLDDQHRDVFFGKPFTTVWDELGKHPGTHGVGATIDVSASYDADGRVKAKSARSLDDSDLHLHSDHFPIEVVYRVKASG